MVGHCTPEEYKELYGYTDVYLRDKLGVYNMLFAWSPDHNFKNEEEYLKYYPGDDYVDLVGMDEYEFMEPQYPIKIAVNKIKIVSDYTQKHNKLAVLTETGLDGIKDSTWFIQRLLKAMNLNKVQLSYILIWANTSWAFWISYIGHPSENDFLEFVHNPLIQLSNNMPDLYQTIK